MQQAMETYNKNEVIFHEGDYQKWMYDIVKGSVEIYANFGKENQILLVTLQAGQYFGEIGLADLLPRTASAVAAEDDTQLSVVSDQNFSEYFLKNPDALLSIMSNIGMRIRSLTADYLTACQAIAEATETVRQGKEKSSGLKAKLSKLVQDYIKPTFMAPSATPNTAVKMSSAHADDRGVRTFKKNEVIFREGDVSDCMYDIYWGKVGIYADYGKASEKLLAELESEQFFGEMGMIDNLPRSATAVSLENDTRLLHIDAADFPKYMQEKPEKVLMIMLHLCNRLRKLTENYTQACRAVSEAENTEAAGSKDGWFRDGLQCFLDDYNESLLFAHQYPELMLGMYDGSYYL